MTDCLIVSSVKIDNPYAPKLSIEDEIQVLDLDNFNLGELPDLESLDQSSLSTDIPTPNDDEGDDDIWQIAFEEGPANKNVTFFTWELFESPGHLESCSPFLSESGPVAFDAALSTEDEKSPTGKVIKYYSLLDSLWNLGLGRSSILFSSDRKSKHFVPSIPTARSTGLSLASSQSITREFILTGGTFVYLRTFVERTYTSPSSVSARVALATAVSTILSAFEDHLGRHSNTVCSVLQLQRLFRKPREILLHVARLVDAVKHVKTNEHLSSLLHHHVLEMEGGDETLLKISTAILCRVAEPSLDFIGEWIGIRKEDASVPVGQRGSFVGIEDTSDEQGPPEYVYKSEMMARFISPEDGNIVYESGNSLRFLKMHHPDHPLTSLEKFGVHAPELEWKFSWEGIEGLATKAKEYEQSLRSAISAYSGGSVPEVIAKVEGSGEESSGYEVADTPDFTNYIGDSMQIFDQPPQTAFSRLPDELELLLSDIIKGGSAKNGSDSIFAPPLSITSSLSFRPLLTTQARFINAATLRLFLRSHQLRLHLSLQRQYQLLNDGVFSSRLASALFDPDRESAERHKGTMRSGVDMGLQLGSRTTWPPASSELRLALMGVLSESYHSSALYASTGSKSINPRDNDELPGQMAFSIRQLTEPEMERVMDPDSLYALDFLRLQYVPPSPLNLVISVSALEKYDHIFKFLLRLLRILFVVSHLPRTYPSHTARQFRLEANHFVNALSAYIFQTGIAEHWEVFETYLSTLETRLAEEDDAGEFGTRVTSGLESIKTAHEQCLDSIMFSLLLRHRQKKVYALLEEIFECILLFAKMQRPDEDGTSAKKSSVDDLYATLKGKTRVFISVTRGLTGKRGYGKGRGTGEENTLERLGVLLEMNGYYSG